MMWLLLLLLGLTQAADERLVLRNGSNPCAGVPQVYYDTKWGFVGSSSLTDKEKSVACRSALCGDLQHSEELLRPQGDPSWMNQLQCQGDEQQLQKCNFSQWTMTASPSPTTSKITCSNNVSVSLEGSSCSGKVRFSKDGGKKYEYFCGENFGQQEGKVLCQSLNCGDLMEIPTWSWSGSGTISTNCLGDEKNLWECRPKENRCSKVAYVYCKGHKWLRLRGNSSNACSGVMEKKTEETWKPVMVKKQKELQRWCQDMFCGDHSSHQHEGSATHLTCTDNVTVVLRHEEKTSQCFGTVHVNHQGTLWPVCATNWNEQNAQLVCQELGCGHLVKFSVTKASSSSILDSVVCTDQDSSLWSCKSKRSSTSFGCSQHVFVICNDGVKLRLSDGPGRCSGRLDLWFEGRWQKARQSQWSRMNSEAVCKDLGCGEGVIGSPSPHRFPQGPHPYLDQSFQCSPDAQSLLRCPMREERNPPREDTIVDITCTGHQEVFFRGGFCSGDVLLSSSSQFFWINSSAQWTKKVASAVCAERKCGVAVKVGQREVNGSSLESGVSLMTLDFCPSDITSVFQCDRTVNQSSNVVGMVSIATVNCSGSKEVTLSGSCSGSVNACENGVCGGVCADVWNDSLSTILCKSLHCGAGFVSLKKKKNDVDVAFHSLHLPQDLPAHLRHVHMGTLVPRNITDQSCAKNSAYVVCTGSLKARLDATVDHCSGNVLVSLEERLVPVCEKVVSDPHTASVICSQLQCGSSEGVIDHYGASGTTQHLFQLECPEGSREFSSCSTSATADQCETKGLRCSEWRQLMLLNREPSCSGVVFVFTKTTRSAVSAAEWTEAETTQLCKDKNCGKAVEQRIATLQETIADAPFWSNSFNCSSIKTPTNLWSCERPNSARSNIQQQLYVSCEAPPTFNLSDGCHGQLKVGGVPVCDSQWKPLYSQRLCAQLKCGAAVLDYKNPDPVQHSGTSVHLSCEGHQTHLEQCQRFKAPCRGRPVSVACSEPVHYKVTDHCGGYIEMKLGESPWEKVCFSGNLPLNIRTKLCEELGCEGPTDHNGLSEVLKLNYSLESCSKDHQHIKFCLSMNQCTNQPAQLYCKGYESPLRPSGPSVLVPVLLSLGLVLTLVIGGYFLLRFYLRRNNTSIKQLLPMFPKRVEEDFESGEYEDPPNLSKDIFAHDDALAVGGAAEKMSSSLSYDNVDDLTQQLTSGSPEHQEDSDQDSYDDIDVVVQTTAEIHPQHPLGGGGGGGGGEGGGRGGDGESADLIPGEDDYLVPPGGQP